MADRAYGIWVSLGQGLGRDQENWFEADRQYQENWFEAERQLRQVQASRATG